MNSIKSEREQVHKIKELIFEELKLPRTSLTSVVKFSALAVRQYGGYNQGGKYWHIKKVILSDRRYPKPRLVCAVAYDGESYTVYIPSAQWMAGEHRKELYKFLNLIESDMAFCCKIRESGSEWYIDYVRNGELVSSFSSFDKTHTAWKQYLFSMAKLEKFLSSIK